MNQVQTFCEHQYQPMSWSLKKIYPTANSDFLCLLDSTDDPEERYARGSRTICSCSPKEADSCYRKTLSQDHPLPPASPRILAGCIHKR